MASKDAFEAADPETVTRRVVEVGSKLVGVAFGDAERQPSEDEPGGFIELG